MRVQVNPAKSRGGIRLRVIDPRSGRYFPEGQFELTPAALGDPRVLRLLPPPPDGPPGGHTADLVPVKSVTSRKSGEKS